MQSSRKHDRLRSSLPEGLFTPLPKATSGRMPRTASCDVNQSSNSEPRFTRRASETSPQLPSLSFGYHDSSRSSSSRRKLVPESLMESARSGPGSWEPAWRVRPNTPVFQELKTCIIQSPLAGTISPLVLEQHTGAGARSPLALNKLTVRDPSIEKKTAPAHTAARVNPLLEIFQESWNNFELFAEFAELGQLQESHLLSSLGKRSTTMDFLELLELLKSLDILADREGFYDPQLTLTMTDVHNVFTAVNMRSYTQWWSSGGAQGDADRNELVFEEFQMLMLSLGKMMGIELDDLVDESGQEVFKNAGIDELISTAKKRSLVNRPGAARHLERLRNQEDVQAGFTSIEAANKACAEENFERARSLAHGAATAFVRHGRPDLLCEVRLLDNIISRQEKSVSIHKKKIQAKVEAKLEETTQLALDLNVEKAATILTSAGKMVESAKLPMKGRLKKKFNAAGEALLCAEQAIEGDEKLSQAWDFIQRDALEEGSFYLEQAIECYGDIQIRTQQIKTCRDALAKKKAAESTIRSGGTLLIDSARDDISNFRFDEAAKTLEEARKHFLEWTAPVGRNQSLVEGLTNLIKLSWNNRELYQSFSSYDDKNLSGQGSRASLMDFTELLHLLRYFGILSDRKMDEEHRPLAERTASTEMTRKMELVEACTNEQIRAEPTCKLAKADVYEEFRAVNRKSMQDLLHGNTEADDDMSSLDFQEYQLLMLRLGKLLGLPLTDVGCSPLFLKDIREVEQMRETLLFVKREAMQGIVHTGEKILLGARNLMQEKSFQEARDEVQLAVAEFQKLDDENMQRVNLASCRRLAEQIDKEERKENTRRADATAMAEAAVKRATQILADFDLMGARYDEHQFDICDREAEAARKFFKAGQAFGKQQQNLIVDITQRAQRSRELIIKLRQAVGDGRDELDSAKLLIQHLLDTSSPPFDKVLALLIDAKEYFVKAKVKDELIEVEETMVTLVDMVGEWIQSNVESGWNHVGMAEGILEKTEGSQLKDAPETESLFAGAFAQHEIATRWFHKAKMADCVIQHQRMIANQNQEDVDSATRRAIAMDYDQDDDPYKDEVVQNLKHRIVDKHEAWQVIRKKEVEDALKIVQECREAISAKAFNSSKELLKKAKQLLKGDKDHIVNELQHAISTAEMNDKESTKTIREQGLAIMDVVRAAVHDGNFELAFDSAEQAMELFDRARDNESMKEVTQTRTETLQKARSKVEESARVAREFLEVGEQALSRKEFEEARKSIQEAKDSISEDLTQNALRVMATDSGVASDQKQVKEKIEELERRLEDQERQYSIILQHERYQASILREELVARAARAKETPLERRHAEIKTMRSRFELAKKLCHGDADAGLETLQPALEAMEEEVEQPRNKRLASAESLLEEAEQAAEGGKAKTAMSNLWTALRLFLEARDFEGVNRSVAKRIQVMNAAKTEKERLQENAMDALQEAKLALPTDAIAEAVQAVGMAKECQMDELLLGFMDPNSAEFSETLAELQTIEAEATGLREEAEQAIATGCQSLLKEAKELLNGVKDHMREKRLVEARVGLSEVKDMLEHMTTLGGQCPELIASDVNFVDVALCAEEEQWRLDENLLRGVQSVAEVDGDAVSTEDIVGSPEPAPPSAASTEENVGSPEPATPSAVDADENNKVVAERAGADEETVAEEISTPKDTMDPSLFQSVQGASKGLSEQERGEATPLLLHKLCQEGNLQVLERILGHAPSLEEGDEQGWTALMHAVHTNHLQCTRMLIDVGADVNARDKGGRTVLMVAAGAERLGAGLDTAKMLLTSGAHVTSVDSDGENVLHYCARSGRDELIEEVLQCLGEESLAETLTTTALLPRMASSRSIKASGSGGGEDSASSSARSTGQKMQQILNEADAHQDLWVNRNSGLLDGFGGNRETPLAVAVKSGKVDSVKRLISWGADLRAKDRDGVGCLQRAAQRGDVAMLSVIVEKIGEVDGVTDEGESALWFASAAGKLDAVSFLLERKANPKLQDKQGWTALHAACWAEGSSQHPSAEDVEQRTEVIKLLLEKGLDPFAGDKKGRDALDLAVMYGSRAALTGLMETLGEDVVRYVGDHLLHVACWSGQTEIVNTFIEMDANPMALTDEGSSPFHAACAKNRVELVKQLAGPNGSELPSPGESWPSPVQISVLTRSRDVLAAMLEMQPEWAWAQDQNGWNSLHVAALLGDSEAAEAILKQAGSTNGNMQIFNEPAVELATPSDGLSEDLRSIMAPVRLFTAGDDAISIARKCLQLAKAGRAPLASLDDYAKLLEVLEKHIQERPVARTSSVPTRVPSQDSMEEITRTESGASTGEDSESAFRLTDGVVGQWFPLPFRPEQHGLWRCVTKSVANGGLIGSEELAEMAMLSEHATISEAISRAERAFVLEERKKAVGLRALVLQAQARVRSGNDRDAYSLMVRAEALAGDREYERIVCLEHRASLRRTWLEGLGQRSKLLFENGAVEETRAVIEEARGKAGWNGGPEDGGVVLQSVENRLIESEVQARLGEVVEEVIGAYCQEQRESLQMMFPSKLAEASACMQRLKSALANGEVNEDDIGRAKVMVEEAWEWQRQGGDLVPEQVEKLEMLSEQAQRLENWFALQKSLSVAAERTSNLVSWFSIGLAQRALRDAEGRCKVLSKQVERADTPLDTIPEVEMAPTDQPNEESHQDPNLISSHALAVRFQDHSTSDGSAMPEPEPGTGTEQDTAPEADREEDSFSVIEEEEVEEAMVEEDTTSDSAADAPIENQAPDSPIDLEEDVDTSTEDVDVPELEQQDLRSAGIQAPEEDRPGVGEHASDEVNFWNKVSQTEGVNFEQGMLEVAFEACSRAKSHIETKRAELVRVELEVVMDSLVTQVEQQTVDDGLEELQTELRDIMSRAETLKEASEYVQCLQQLEKWEAVMQKGLYPAQIRSIEEFVAMQDSVSFLLKIQQEAEERLASAFALLEAHDLNGAKQQYAESRRRFRDAREKRSEKREAFYAFETSATNEEVCGLVFEIVEAAFDMGEASVQAAATRALEDEIAIARADLEKGDWRAMEKHLEESKAAFMSSVGEAGVTPGSHADDIESLRVEAERLRRAEEVLDQAEAEKTTAEEALNDGELGAVREAAERGRELTGAGDLDAVLTAAWDANWKDLEARVDRAEVQIVLEDLMSQVEQTRETELADALHEIVESAIDRAQTAMVAMADAEAQALKEGLVALKEQVQIDAEQAQRDGGTSEDVDRLLGWLQGISHCQVALEAHILADSALGDRGKRTKRDLLLDKQTALTGAEEALQAAEASRQSLPPIALEWPAQISPESTSSLIVEVQSAQESVRQALREKEAAESKCKIGLQSAESAMENQEWQAALDAVDETMALINDISEMWGVEVSTQAQSMRSRAAKGQRIEVLQQEVAAANIQIPELLASKLFDRAREVADRVLEHKRELLKLGIK